MNDPQFESRPWLLSCGFTMSWDGSPASMFLRSKAAYYAELKKERDSKRPKMTTSEDQPSGPSSKKSKKQEAKEEEEEVFPDDSVSSFFPEDKIPPKSNATVVRDLPSSANSVVFDRKDSQSVVSSVSHGSSSRFSGVHVPKIVRIFETEKVDEEDEDDDSIHVPLS